MGRKLYYFHKKSGLEIDFVIRCKSECTLVEVKAVSGNAKSIRTYLNHPEKYHVYSAIKLGNYNIGKVDEILTLPLYLIAKMHISLNREICIFIFYSLRMHKLQLQFITKFNTHPFRNSKEKKYTYSFSESWSVFPFKTASRSTVLISPPSKTYAARACSFPYFMSFGSEISVHKFA